MDAESTPVVSKFVEIFPDVSRYHARTVLPPSVTLIGYCEIERELVTDNPIASRGVQHGSRPSGAIASFTLRQNAEISTRPEFAVRSTLIGDDVVNGALPLRDISPADGGVVSAFKRLTWGCESALNKDREPKSPPPLGEPRLLAPVLSSTAEMW